MNLEFFCSVASDSWTWNKITDDVQFIVDS